MQSRGWAVTWRKCVLLVAFVTTIGVCSLMAQSPQELELTRAGRQFRRQVYLRYRTNRPEFDRRRAAAVQAESAYRAAGADAESADRFRNWLLAAAAASQSNAALPPLPGFGPEARVAETHELPSPMTGEPQGPEAPETPKATGERPSIVELEKPSTETPSEPVRPPVVPAEVTPTKEPTTPIAQPSEPPTDTPYHDDMPTANTPAAEPTEEPAPGIEQPASPTAEATEATTPAMEENIFDNPPAEVETEVETEMETTPSTESLEKAPMHEMTPAPAAPEPAPGSTFEPNQPSSSGVNVSELSARVAGHNFAVRGILLDWRRSGNDNVEELTQAVEQTETLGRRYGMLQTYTGLLTETERTKVEDLESLDSVFTTLGNAIADVRERVESSDAPEAERVKSVDQLNQLSKRLAAAFAVYQHDSEQQP